MRTVIHVIIFLTINKKQEWEKKDMMKRERKQVTIYKVSKIFIKTLLLIMMAMAVGMFAPIGARAADQTITENTKTSELIALGMGANDTLYVDGTVTLTVDEPLTIYRIYGNNYSYLTITGNAGLTLNADDNNAINAEDLRIINCSINATTANNYHTIAAVGNISIDNSNVTVNGINGCAGIMTMYRDISITNNSVVNVSGMYGIRAGGNLSISGAGTQVIIVSTNYAMRGWQGISLNDGLIITEPAGGVIRQDVDDSLYYICESNETTKAKKVTIKKPVPVAPTVNNTNSGQKEPSHTHSFSWVVTKSPTSTSDGEEAYMCSCGEIERTSILPAISAFEEETINKIKNAPANAVIEVETSLFNSFGIGVRNALAARPDVTLKVRFLSEGYRGQLLKVTIPTGIDRYALWDEKGWLGLCRAGSTLGYDK